MDVTPRVSVIIPAFNEARSVGAVVGDIFKALGKNEALSPFEVIVVDDGSQDETAQAAEQAGAKVIRGSQRRGYGAALKRGIYASKANRLAIVDADETYPVEQLPEMIKLMDEGAEQVIGARVTKDAHVPLFRWPAKWAVTWLAMKLTKRDILDLNSGMRCFSRRRVERCIRFLPNGFSVSTCLTVIALLEEWEVRWLPIGYRKRTGSSKFKAIQDTCRLLLSLLRAVVYCDPIKLFLPLAVAFGIMALGCGIWDVFVEENLADKTVIFSIGALEWFVLGLLADIIVKKL
jgi:glycosyltransferase involved in cell wall biosynthesis